MKILVRLVVVLVLIVIAGWVFRKPILLNAPGMIARLAQPIGPNEPIEWPQGPEAAEQSPDNRPPNIVVILADDLGFNDVSTYGGGLAGGSVPTPNIDALAAAGVTFANGYAGNAVCAPSRAMLMTGRYSTRFGFEFTPTPDGMGRLMSIFMEGRDVLRAPVYNPADRGIRYADMGMPTDEVTIAELLSERGYYTAHIGKWHLGRSAGFAPNDQGFDDSLLMASAKYLPDGHPDVVNSRQDFDPIDAFLWPNTRWAASFNGSELFEPGGYLTDYWTDEAIKVIEANRNRPFFLYLAHWAPHTPLQAWREDYEALSHIEDHTLRVYAAMVKAVDRSVGRVLDALEATGLTDNTLVIFTSDNGGAGYVGLPDLNQPYRGWKLTLFEGGTHIPFAARWPAAIPAGVRYEEPVSHLDVFSTAAAAAGAALPTDRPIDGVDLVPFVRGEAEGVPHDVLIWREGYYQSVLANGWKLQVSDNPSGTWLFNLADDPTEQDDLSSSRPDKLAELQALLAAHNAEQADPLWPSMAEMPVYVDKTLADEHTPDDEYIYWPN